MGKRKKWKTIGTLVLLFVLCTNAVTAHAQGLSDTASVYQARWKVLQACVLDCTIFSNRIASVYSDAVATNNNYKLKVTATLTRYDMETDTWTDLCSVTDTDYGQVTVETDYMIPNQEGLYYNRTNIVTYNANGTVAERIELFSDSQYFAGN